ncbi:MAG: hypothetical protein IJC16_06510 [Rikenellaceae bacterium]|nr:hypothetical protein [Rikenellaceae bacterium]
MKKTLIFCLLLATATAAQAQQDELNRSMEVTREYEPTLRTATKLGTTPNFTDTVALRPDLRYGIRPNPLGYGFEVAPIRAANVDASVYRPLTPFYLKAGLGYPLRSVLDFNYSPEMKGRGTLGAYLNHLGSFADIKNTYGIKQFAPHSYNRAGIYGEHHFGRLMVGGEAGYDYDLISRYGGQATRPGDVRLPYRQTYNTAHAGIVFGTPFTDLTYFNYRVGAKGYYFFDHFDNHETNINPYFELGKRFGGQHQVTLLGSFDNYSFKPKADEYTSYKHTNRIYHVAPQYELVGQRFGFTLGFEYVHANSGLDDLVTNIPDLSIPRDKKSYFFPKFHMKVDAFEGAFVPYIDIDGRLWAGGYRSAARLNPYIRTSSFVPNTAEYTGRIGLRGDIGSAFSYKVFGGLSIYKDIAFFETDRRMSPNLMRPIVYDANQWTIGGELAGRIAGAFDLTAAFQYYGWNRIKQSGMKFDHAGGMPNFEGSLGVRYSYRDKFTAHLQGTVYGRSYWYSASMSQSLYEEKVSPQFELNLELQYNISRKVGIYVNGTNLTGSKLYFYGPCYPMLGAGFDAGVKLSF